MTCSSLPRVDEHATTVEADVDDVWRAVLDTVDRTFSGAVAQRYARLVGCADHAATGVRPLAEGSTVPGFRVVSAVPGRELVLEGRHRFSSYALIFRIDEREPGRARLRAETRAAFPGLSGRIYRGLLLRSGGHVAGVRRLLAAARRRAEQRTG